MVTQLDHVLVEEKLANIMAGNSWWKKVTLIWERDGLGRIFECSMDLADWKLYCLSREESLSSAMPFTSSVYGRA
jgi:hypothetical protein